MPATKHTQHVPATMTEYDHLYGWIKIKKKKKGDIHKNFTETVEAQRYRWDGRRRRFTSCYGISGTKLWLPLSCPLLSSLVCLLLIFLSTPFLLNQQFTSIFFFTRLPSVDLPFHSISAEPTVHLHFLLHSSAFCWSSFPLYFCWTNNSPAFLCLTFSSQHP